MAALDGTGLDGVEHLQAGNDFTTGKDADLELAVSGGFDPPGDDLASAEDGVQAFRKAGRHAPADFGHALGDGRHGEGAGATETAGTTQRSRTQERQGGKKE